MSREADRSSPLDIRGADVNRNCTGIPGLSSVKLPVPYSGQMEESFGDNVLQLPSSHRGSKTASLVHVRTLGKMQKNKGKQFRWSKPMRHLLLEILSDEARKGNKMSSTFKPESRARVARAISERFGVECYPNHVKNHLRTVKSVRNTIEAIRNSKRGFGWDENSKMITCERKKHVEEVKAHPNHDKYLNKPIEMYDEIVLVAGNDMGIRSSSKPLSDIDCPENLRDLESVVMDLGSEKVSKAKQAGSSSRLLSQLEASLERETKILRKINAVLCENGDSEKALMVMELGGITLMTIMIFLFRIWDEESEEGTSDEEETSDEEY